MSYQILILEKLIPYTSTGLNNQLNLFTLDSQIMYEAKRSEVTASVYNHSIMNITGAYNLACL